MKPGNVHKSDAGWRRFQNATEHGKRKRPGMMTRRDFKPKGGRS